MRIAQAVFVLLLCGTTFAQGHKVGVNKYVIPKYPPIARQARVFSDVVLDLELNAQGDVSEVNVVRAHPMLKQASLDAIKQWRFVCLDCRPGEEFRHRFTFSWRVIDQRDCGMTGFHRTVLEFPSRLTVEESELCVLPTAGPQMIRTVRTGLFRKKKTYIYQTQ